LVITGKGGRDEGRGVLRRQVPLWLALPELRRYVIGFEDAHVAHGGKGALYVRVRRATEGISNGQRRGRRGVVHAVGGEHHCGRAVFLPSCSAQPLSFRTSSASWS